MDFHPLADVFPLLQGREFDELVADIKASGLRIAIVLHTDGRILDGRNRYRACLAAGVEPRYSQWDGVGLAADFVWSLNGPRRHLEGGALQIAAGKYAIAREHEARERQGARTDLTSSPVGDEVEFGRSVDKAAEKFGVGRGTVERAVKVVKDGAPELTAAVETGMVSVSAAADVAALPKDEQREIVAKGEKQILEAAKEIRARKAEERRDERLERVREISAGNAELNVAQRYPVIYADPPWRYDYTETEARAIENQYPTMDLDAICRLPVRQLATEDAVLFLWGTSPKLVEALRVIEAWGFTYRTCAVWHKPQIGMGYYFRQQHELLLVATRGNLPAPAPANRVGSVITADRTAHSAKPAEFAESIERMYPTLPKIELFCRAPRAGWSVWGNQSAA